MTTASFIPAVLALCAMSLTACRPRGEEGPPAAATADTASGVSARPAIAATDSASIERRAREVLTAFTSRHGSALAALVHPAKGVRFSPYAFVRPENDVVIRRDEIARLFSDSTRRTWGQADGSGDPLVLTFDAYYRRFVQDVDFSAAPSLAFDRNPIRAGNTPSNLREIYPASHWMEFHYPGFEQRYEGMDWRSLWLVFEPVDGIPYLVGVVHGSWTI